MSSFRVYLTSYWEGLLVSLGSELPAKALRHYWTEETLKLLRAPYYLAILLWLACLPITLLLPDLQSAERFLLFLTNLVQDAAPMAILALGVGLVVAAGSVDLSVAGVATITGVLWAYASHQTGASSVLAYSLALSFGPISGWILGMTISARKAPALITSWAFSTIYFVSAALLLWLWSLNKSVDGMSVVWIPLSQGYASTILGIPLVWAFLGALALSIGLVWSTQIHTQSCAVGANWKSASFIGLPTDWIERATFVFSGLFAGVAGILFAISHGGASLKDLAGNELIAIAIAVLGGTSMSGGYYAAISIACAAFFWRWLYTMTLVYAPGPSPEIEARLVQVLFALILIIVGILFGGIMSGNTRSIQIRHSKVGGR